MTNLLRSAGVALWAVLPVGGFGQATTQAGAPGPEAQIRAAESALERHDMRSAADLLRKINRERPHDVQVLYDLGYAEEALGNESGAKQAYMAALTEDPGFGEAHVALGLLLARTASGNRTEAEAQLRAGADSAGSPPEVRARALRTLSSLEQKDNPSRAADDLLAAVKLTRETQSDIVESADLAAAEGHTADAEKAYRRALREQPNDAAAATGLAQVLEGEQKFPEADEVLSASLGAHPNDPRVLASLAAVKAKENKPGDAVALLEPLVPPGTAQRNPPLARELARLYSMTDQREKAEALYSELVPPVSAESDDPTLLDDYGDVLVRDAKFAQAEATLQRAVAHRAAWGKPGDWAEAEGHLAFAASRNHDPQAALQALAARATVLPNSPASLFLEATAHDALKQNGEAQRAYRAFLAAADGHFPDEEFEARHRLVALERTK